MRAQLASKPAGQSEIHKTCEMSERCQVQYHEVLPTEDDPKGEQHGVEDALPDVSKKQHPGPVEANGKPLHWDVDESHGNTQSQDYPVGAIAVLKL